MKIKSLILILLISLLPLQSFAKDSFKAKSGKTVDGDIDAIKNFDIEKVFSEAETYYKAAKAWEKIKCTPKTGFICSKWECTRRDSKVTVTLDKKKETITRCDGKQCETFDAEFKQTGVFYNIQTEGPIGTLIRVLGDNRYKEITTVGLDAYIANGNCKVVVD